MKATLGECRSSSLRSLCTSVISSKIRLLQGLVLQPGQPFSCVFDDTNRGTILFRVIVDMRFTYRQKKRGCGLEVRWWNGCIFDGLNYKMDVDYEISAVAPRRGCFCHECSAQRVTKAWFDTF